MEEWFKCHRYSNYEALKLAVLSGFNNTHLRILFTEKMQSKIQWWQKLLEHLNNLTFFASKT